MKKVSVRLQEGLVVVDMDPSRKAVPAAIWKEIIRVGFLPAQMEVWVAGISDGRSIGLDGARWPLEKPGSQGSVARRYHLKVQDGAEDPPRVKIVD